MAPREEALLAAAGKLWLDVQSEFDEPSSGAAEDGTGEGLQPEELKKVAQWLQRSVTKFGASAAVADAGDEPALDEVATQVITALTAALGTLLSLRRGAGASLRAELREIGAALSAEVVGLGAAVGTDGVPLAAGKLLERVKRLERLSPNSRAAVRRRLLTSLSQLRDARRELKEALEEAAEEEVMDDDFKDDFELEGLDEEEKRVVEALDAAAGLLEDILKRASQHAGGKGEEPDAPTVGSLEAAVGHAAGAVCAIDSLATHVIGGLDAEAFGAELEKLRAASAGLAAAVEAEDPAPVLEALSAALRAAGA